MVAKYTAPGLTKALLARLTAPERGPVLPSLPVAIVAARE